MAHPCVEDVQMMEPLVISSGSKHYAELTDLAIDLAAKASGFKRSLPEGVNIALANMVRAMNCYYSNLIEGHATHPVDIEKALNGDFSANREKRNLQQEAKAHVEVQGWIDAGGLESNPVSTEALREIHRRFCRHLPDELLYLVNPDADEKLRVRPGELRETDVAVGRHVAIGFAAVPKFLKRFEQVYSSLGRSDSILNAAAAHHRLLWIHPFLDGNGRVARLMSHAMFLNLLDTGGVWSVARGLARNVDQYKAHLAACDLPRRNDLDGRGSMSEETLVEFTRFFLKICIDQIEFMEKLMEPGRLRARLLMWAEEEARIGSLNKKAGQVLEAVLYRGELPRGELPGLLNLTDRQTRRITHQLALRGVLENTLPKEPLRLAFPATLASRLMPGLFPDKF